MPVDNERILVVTDLLLGAAYADNRLKGKEVEAVRKIINQIKPVQETLAIVNERIEQFIPYTFDLKSAADKFSADEIITKRNLLEFVAAVSHADEELDLAEDEYLHNLAKTLGMEEKEYSDLSLEYEVEDLQEHFDIVVSVPPPEP